MKPSLGLRALASVLLWACALCAGPAFAQTFRVTVDTSTLAGESGYVNFQFNPADLLAPAAAASVLDWTGNISLLDAPSVEGSVTGALPTTLSLRNDSVFNDYFQSVRFGDVLSFIVQFTGNVPTPISSDGTSFALSLYAADATSPLLSNDISGSIVRFDLIGGGLLAQTFSPLAQVAPVPLPAAAWLLLSGMAGLAGVRKRVTNKMI